MSTLPAAAALPIASLLAKTTLLIALAGLVTASPIGRRASAATRHLVWMLALAGVLALPVLSALLPAWSVVTVAAPAPVAEAVNQRPTAAPAAVLVSQQRTPDAAPETPAAREPAPQAALPPGAGLAALYLAGVLLLMGRVLLGRRALRRLAAGATVPDEGWQALLRELSWVVGLDRPVRLLQSRESAMPMTWGTRHPCILLPGDADLWSAERRRVVLLHELAHVSRRDCLAQQLAALACAVYWMHPGVWYTARRLRVERELACDDRVLAAGTRARAYATHLLEVARAFRPMPYAEPVAVSMARPSHLEGRMLAVLDQLRSRRAPTAPAVLAATTGWALLLVPLAVAAAAPAQAAAPWSYGEQEPMAVARGRVVEHEIAARSGGRLTLELETGGELEVIGWDRNLVTLHAELDGRDWKSTRVELMPEAAGVVVRAHDASGRASYGTGHRFRLHVPRRYDVTVHSTGGGIRMRGLAGTFAGSTRGGQIELRDLRGIAQLSTRGGEVRVADSHLEGRVSTRGGNVTLSSVEGALQGYTASGEVVRTGAEAHRITIAGMAEPTGDAARLIRLAFADPDERVQLEAVESLTNLPDGSGLDGLKNLAVNHPRDSVRGKAADGLGRLACDESISTLAGMVAHDRSLVVQREAVESLALTYPRTDVQRVTRPEQIRAALERIARVHPAAAVRAKASQALAGISGRS